MVYPQLVYLPLAYLQYCLRLFGLICLLGLAGCSWQASTSASSPVIAPEVATANSDSTTPSNTTAPATASPATTTVPVESAPVSAVSSAADATNKPKVTPAANMPYPYQEMIFTERNVQSSLWPEQITAFPAPDDAAMARFDLWSTHYRVHVAEPVENGVPLQTLQGQVLAVLSPKDWCYAALEGTVLVAGNSGQQVYNYAGRGKNRQTDCSPWFFRFKDSLVRAMETTRFSAVKAPFGTGAKGWWLVPFRSIAVDRKIVPIGTVVYIPTARGQTVVLPDGRMWTHDGYFLAADTGGAIKQNHIDMYTGFYPDNPFPALASSKRKQLVEAYLVDNAEIQQQLIQQHKPRR